MQFIGLFLSAIVVEGIISYIKPLFKKREFQWVEVWTILLGIVVSVTYQIDLFAIAGLTASIPYVGIVLTGILISRGSNYIYDIIKTITTFTKRVVQGDETQATNESNAND